MHIHHSVTLKFFFFLNISAKRKIHFFSLFKKGGNEELLYCPLLTVVVKSVRCNPRCLSNNKRIINQSNLTCLSVSVDKATGMWEYI